jgi:hypothetical protein
MTDLIQRLRQMAAGLHDDMSTGAEAADALESQAAEIALQRGKGMRLESELFDARTRMADQAAEIERLRADADRWRYVVANCEWLRQSVDGEHYSLLAVRLPYEADQSCVAMRNAAIDAARAAMQPEVPT